MLFSIKLFLKSKWINNVLILQQLSIVTTAILTIYYDKKLNFLVVITLGKKLYNTLD